MGRIAGSAVALTEPPPPLVSDRRAREIPSLKWGVPGDTWKYRRSDAKATPQTSRISPYQLTVPDDPILRVRESGIRKGDIVNLRAAIGGLGLAAALVVAPSLVPTDAPVPSALKAEPASAGVWDCISVARNTFRVTGGDFSAALRAGRSVPGCGDTLSSGICWTSRQWWGGGARWTISQITGGRYSTC